MSGSHKYIQFLFSSHLYNSLKMMINCSYGIIFLALFIYKKKNNIISKIFQTKKDFRVKVLHAKSITDRETKTHEFTTPLVLINNTISINY